MLQGDVVRGDEVYAGGTKRLWSQNSGRVLIQRCLAVWNGNGTSHGMGMEPCMYWR